MPDMMQLLANSMAHQLDIARELILLMVVGFLIAVLADVRNWRSEVRKLLPSSLRVNLFVYLVDAVVMSVPLALLIGFFHREVRTNDFLLFSVQINAWPSWVTFVAAVVLGDFVGYWRHRIEHSAFLWPAHSLHHSDEEMTWFTLFRFHPINRLSTVVIDYGVLLVLGIPLWAIVASGSIRHFYGMFVHVNRPWTLGYLGAVFVSPAMHRWHHVRAGQGMFSNYATIFSVFDRLFGTHYVPGPCDQALGVDGVRHTEFFSQMLLPFSALLKKAKRNQLPEGRPQTEFGNL